jgi:uncharacterized iron-regulated membrane protein
VILGILLVIQVSCGCVLLFRPELYRMNHPELFAATGTRPAITATDALRIAQATRPLPGAEARLIDGVFQVRAGVSGPATYIDAGSGRVLGVADPNGGFLGLLTNLHACGLSCAKFPGYQPWLAWTWLAVPVGYWLIALIGATLAWWCVSGLLIWWPGIRHLVTRLTIHLRRGFYRAVRDLHDVLGAVMLVFLLFWGLTGVGFLIPAAGSVWYSITGTHSTTRTVYSIPGTGPDVSADSAVAAARALVPAGRVVTVAEPGPKPTDTYRIDFEQGTTAGRGIVPLPPTSVSVDRHTAAATITRGGDVPIANSLWDKWTYAIHFGSIAPWPLRLGWLVIGFTPILLAASGIYTWLHRRRRISRSRT